MFCAAPGKPCEETTRMYVCTGVMEHVSEGELMLHVAGVQTKKAVCRPMYGGNLSLQR